VISIVGLAAGFVSALGGVVMVALDALAILFTFAGGVVCLSSLPCQSGISRYSFKGINR